MNEIILVDKPSGWTSFDVVAKIRGAIRASYAAKGLKPTKRQLKVGHAGTLDPFATGLLIILLGDACSRANEFLKSDKVYEATIRLGATSTTGDPEGEITKIERSKDRKIEDSAVPDTEPTHAAVLEALERFTGEVQQTPPVFSAIKIGGERAYKLARAGREVAMPTRTVTIYSLELIDYTYPNLTVRANVSSGTYIRSLAEDIGKKLGVGAYCLELRRTRIGQMLLQDAQTVESVLETTQFNNHDNDNYDQKN